MNRQVRSFGVTHCNDFVAATVSSAITTVSTTLAPRDWGTLLTALKVILQFICRRVRASDHRCANLGDGHFGLQRGRLAHIAHTDGTVDGRRGGFVPIDHLRPGHAARYRRCRHCDHECAEHTTALQRRWHVLHAAGGTLSMRAVLERNELQVLPVGTNYITLNTINFLRLSEEDFFATRYVRVEVQQQVRVTLWCCIEVNRTGGRELRRRQPGSVAAAGGTDVRVDCRLRPRRGGDECAFENKRRNVSSCSNTCDKHHKDQRAADVADGGRAWCAWTARRPGCVTVCVRLLKTMVKSTWYMALTWYIVQAVLITWCSLS